MPPRNLIWLGAIAVAAIIAVWASRPAPHQDAPRDEHLRAIGDACRTIQRNYHRPVDDSELVRLAIKGLAQIDEYSTYVPPEQIAAFQARVGGSWRDIGLRLEVVEGEATVLGSLAGSPAHKAGIFGGDKLLEVNGRDVAGMTLEQIKALLDDESPEVRLTVLQAAGRRQEYRLPRGQAPVETVTGLFRNRAGQWVHYVDPEETVAYVRVKEFTHDTVGTLNRVVRQFGAPKALILDLRDNPGGLLAAAVGVADLFLREGTIVTSVGRDGQPVVYRAHSDDTLPDDLALVVLVNESTASAAEIVAGALRLHDRAVVVGARTTGKGSVQSLIPLESGMGQINLTTAEYFIGENVPISRRAGATNWGVEPHVHCPLPPGRREELSALRVRSEVVPRPSAATLPTTGPHGEEPLENFLSLDAQLAKALELAGDPDRVRQTLREAAAGRADRKTHEDRPATD